MNGIYYILEFTMDISKPPYRNIDSIDRVQVLTTNSFHSRVKASKLLYRSLIQYIVNILAIYL
jgi:hypothetical protein